MYYNPAVAHTPTVIHAFCANANGLTLKQMLKVGGVIVRIYLDHCVDVFLHLLFTVYKLVGIYIKPPAVRTHPPTVIQGFRADA